MIDRFREHWIRHAAGNAVLAVLGMSLAGSALHLLDRL